MVLGMQVYNVGSLGDPWCLKCRLLRPALICVRIASEEPSQDVFSEECINGSPLAIIGAFLVGDTAPPLGPHLGL